MTKQDWRLEKVEDLRQAIKESKILAKDFEALSEQFAEIAKELDLGGDCKPINASGKANEIRALLAKRNKLCKTISEAVRDLRAELKNAGILS